MSDSFSDWASKLAEAYCVENAIPCKRRFTDMELERPREEIRKAALEVENIYANAMVKREQLERHAERPDHDLDCRGMPLYPGR